MKSEKIVQSECIKLLNSRGIYNFKVMRANRSGVSDLIACVPVFVTDRDGVVGQLWSIEVKAEGKIKNTSKQQDRELELVRKSGGKALVIDDSLDLELLLP